MIPLAYPHGASRYVKEMIKICEWVKNEMSALNLLCNGLYRDYIKKPYGYNLSHYGTMGQLRSGRGSVKTSPLSVLSHRIYSVSPRSLLTIHHVISSEHY